MKLINITGMCAALLMLSSCSMFEIDNYDEPEETIQSRVIDVKTGNPVLTDQGSEGIRVRLTELSWGDNVEHNPDFFCRPDGTFQNTKIFKGNYNIRIDGPFIPLVRETPDGTVLADETITTDIKGTTKVEFKVQPFLNVKIVGDPTVSNGVVKAKVVVERGVSEEEFKEKIQPMGNWDDNYLNMTDIQFFVSYSNSVGYRARDDRWSSSISYSGNSFNDLFGTPVTITSNGTIPSGRKVWVRAAARINYDTPVGSGTRRWNYSEPIEVMIP